MTDSGDPAGGVRALDLAVEDKTLVAPSAGRAVNSVVGCEGREAVALVANLAVIERQHPEHERAKIAQVDAGELLGELLEVEAGAVADGVADSLHSLTPADDR